MTNRYDFVVIGAGIIGLSCARELMNKYPNASIAIIEKENTVAAHASGRNSGVIHAGIYYGKDSLKARFCLEGGRKLKEYCYASQLPVNHCGKLIVAKNESELPALDTLYRKALDNGARVERVNARQAAEIEPRAVTCEKAIWSPETASIMPGQVCHTLAATLQKQGVRFFFGEPVSHINPAENSLGTRQNTFSYGFLINAAGLYADTISEQYGLTHSYMLMPFKGLYFISQSPRASLNTNIYPVPDANYPFLGVHFTITGDGKTKVGPTALPVLWREQYSGLKGLSYKEMKQITAWYLNAWYHNHFNFRALVKSEARYLFKKNLLAEAQKMVNIDLSKVTFAKSQPGIRAQLYDKVNKELVTDFVIKSVENSVHVLNAVSPAFTSAFSVADYVVNTLIDR